MLSSAYLSRNLTSPIATKDGGTLRTIGEACEYMAAIGRERELRPHWQGVRKLMLQEADVVAVSRWVRLAVLKDAKVDVTALSEPLERWMDEPPPGLVLVEKNEPATESNERSDSESKDERRRQEELQQAETRQAAEDEHRRQEELQQAEARQAAEEEGRRPQEAENKPFWNRFLTKLRARDS
jgi:hypothetical protein